MRHIQLDTSTSIHIEIHQFTNHTEKKNKYTEPAPEINITAAHNILHNYKSTKKAYQRGFNQRLHTM